MNFELTEIGNSVEQKLYHGKPPLQRHRLGDIQQSKGIPWQLYQPVDIMISTRLIWLPWQAAGNQLPNFSRRLPRLMYAKTSSVI